MSSKAFFSPYRDGGITDRPEHFNGTTSGVTREASIVSEELLKGVVEAAKNAVQEVVNEVFQPCELPFYGSGAIVTAS